MFWKKTNWSIINNPEFFLKENYWGWSQVHFSFNQVWPCSCLCVKTSSEPDPIICNIKYFLEKLIKILIETSYQVFHSTSSSFIHTAANSISSSSSFFSSSLHHNTAESRIKHHLVFFLHLHHYFNVISSQGFGLLVSSFFFFFKLLPSIISPPIFSKLGLK